MFSNIRFGLATNSSSSHSIVLLGPTERVEDSGDGSVGEFGWEDFTCATPESKMQWLGQLVKSFFENRAKLTDDLAAALADTVLDCDALGHVMEDGYVDHQSNIALPGRTTMWGVSNDINREFLSDFKSFLLRDDVVILGGNDNSDGHPLAGQIGTTVLTELFSGFADYGGERIRARKEGDGWWTVIDPDRKFRVTVDFLNPHQPRQFGKLVSPLLVDLKITDFCAFGCSYCYQGSTTTGDHADLGKVSHAVRVLREMNTLEVAIGGGEPTTHPDFEAIVKLVVDGSMVCNFTTRNIPWFRTAAASRVMPMIGGVAISIDSASMIDRVLRNIPGEYRSKISFQYVMGSGPYEEFKDIARACHAAYRPLTLLGFKYTGRGGGWHPIPHDGWLDFLRELPITVSIDTELARQNQEVLDAAGIPRVAYVTKEGEQSMYWDAVTGRVGPSSYALDDLMRPTSRGGRYGDLQTGEIRQLFEAM